MCGILGAVNRRISQQQLDTLRHRGPDDSDIAELRVGAHQVMLGHRRLSILDLSEAGRQPMLTASGQHAIVFNGEIYNHLELRRELNGTAFRGHSDTETTLYCLAASGVQAVRRFNGIFALGFVDIGRKKMYLVRDTFGVKPVYYWADASSLVFSSELRPILQMVSDDIDPASLAELLRLRYLPAPDTMFKNIRKLRPGHILEIELSGSRIWFCERPFIEPAPADAKRKSFGEAREHYGWLLERAVERQLMSDVEVGVFLSGGIDSALVSRFAQAHTGRPVKAFTVGFSGRDSADEIEDARQTARAIGLEHYDVRIGPKEFVETLPRVTAIVEEPLATTSVVPMFHLSALASKYVKVVLSGQGADEAQGGYGRYQAEVLRPYVPRVALPPLRKASGWIGLTSDMLARGLNSIGEADDVRRFLQIYTVFDPDQIRSLTGSEETRAADRIEYFFRQLGCPAQRHSAERMMTLDLRMNLADDLLLYTDKITMHHSIECRVPLLDHELVRFVEGLPRQYRVGVLRRKVLHKQFARSVLPGRIVRRKKKGFLSPTRDWFNTGSVIRDILLDGTSRFSSYFESGPVLKVLNEHAGGFNRERQIFLLLSIYYWLAEFG